MRDNLRIILREGDFSFVKLDFLFTFYSLGCLLCLRVFSALVQKNYKSVNKQLGQYRLPCEYNRDELISFSRRELLPPRDRVQRFSRQSQLFAKRESKTPSFVLLFLCFSAFPKGPHQLGSRNPNKPGLEDCSRSHHFTAYLLLQESHKVSPFDRGGYHASRGLANLVSTLSCRLRSIQIVETQVRAISQVAGAFLCRCLSTFMRNSQGRKNSKERLLRYTFQEPWSKGNQESFRRVPRERAETPKSWNSSRCYKEHPYWTNNLKYAR
jgi:hypothetical protein